MFTKPLLPGVLWTILIGVLMFTPGNYFPKVSPFFDWLGPDKLVHLLLFGTYSYLLSAGFSRQGKCLVVKRKPLLFSLFTGMIFAIFTEVMQMYIIPGRNGNIYDLLANVLGCLLGISIWKIIQKNWK